MPIEFTVEEKNAWNKRLKPQRKQDGDKRPSSERDRSRVIHSAAFRRLQNKTQVFGIGESDFYRTRLTHSMEVAQIGRGIVLQLKKTKPEYAKILPNHAQIEAICLAHDLGHPPFGHSGEIALNYAMEKHGGFEGNGQSLRIVTKLEKHTTGFGLNLTRRILLGILKYPCGYARANRTARPSHNLLEGPAKAWGPPKCYLDCEQGIVDWMLEPLKPTERELFTSLPKLPTDVDCGETIHSSLDASIMTVADDIAYGVHDLEDGIAFRLIKREHIKALDDAIDVVFGKAGLARWNAKKLRRSLFEPYKTDPTRKQAIGALIHAMILCLEVDPIDGFVSPLVKYRVKLSSEAYTLLKKLKNLNKHHIIFSQPVQTLEFRGRKMVTEMFGAIMSEPSRLLDEYHRDRLERDFATDGKVARIVCDYVASMSDSYATRFYGRLFVPGEGSAFERL